MHVTMRPGELTRNEPDRLLPPISRECAPLYWQYVAEGEQVASRSTVAIVGLCRDSMPWIRLNTQRIEKLGSRFCEWLCMVYENDSQDGTAEYLREWAGEWEHIEVVTETHDRPCLSHEKSGRRTHALAEYRQLCLEWARKVLPDYVIVVDLDNWGGWSLDGVMTGLAWLQRKPDAAGMASVSTVEMELPGHPDGKIRIHYDSWAARMNHWAEHDMSWFPHWFPPVGSEPVPFRSAFGGLCVYRAAAFLAGRYAGPDCEHVAFHRSIREATGLGMYVNPSQRIVMTWIPEACGDGGQHSDD